MVEIDEGFAEFTEGDETDEEAGGGEDGEEIAEDKDELSTLGPVESSGYLEDGSGEDPGETDGHNRDEEVEKQAFGAPCDSFQHCSGVAQGASPVVQNY